jgi:hypothetical protein
VDVIPIAGGQFVPVSAVTVSKYDFQRRLNLPAAIISLVDSLLMR